jgi:DNA-binding Lrp family transcriptional regulator
MEADMPTKGAARRGMRAFVLIETAPGKTKSVKKELSRIAGAGSTLVHLDAVTGPYDFIAQVEGPTLDAIGRLVTDEIGAIDGVTRTTTCVAVTIG